MLSARPLDGITVVDLTSNVAAPFASAVLADLGAQVVHVEGPRGDDCRRMSPVRGDSSAYFEVVNRGKDVVVLDVRTPDGRAALDALLGTADVLVTNLRPGKLEGLRLDAASLDRSYPRLIHASLSAYGPTGPERDKPGYDAVLQARTGIAAVTGTADGPPVRAGVSILDVGAGTWLALAVVTALYERERTGRGGAVATSLFETGASWVAYHVAAHQVTGEPSGRHGSGHPAFAPYGIFTTGDGEICLGIGGDALFERLCEAIERPDLLADSRFTSNADRSANAVALRAELERTFAGAPADEWAQRLGSAGLPVDAVQRPEDLLSDPQADRTGILIDLPGAGLRVPGLPVTFDGVRPRPRGPVPPDAG